MKPLLRNTISPLFALTVGVALWWGLGTPVVRRTIPPDGATQVPRNTLMLIELDPVKDWIMGGSSQGPIGMSAIYTDTGEPVDGVSGARGTAFIVKPQGLLRPNAPVELTVFDSHEHRYTLHFTTGDNNAPTATPFAEFADFPRGMPTTAPPPTVNP